MKKYAIICLLILSNFITISSNNSINEKIIFIENQTDFDNLNSKLNSMIFDLEDKNNIIVKFKSASVFKFNDNNKIILYSSTLFKKNITLEFTTTSGNKDVYIISDGNEYERPSNYTRHLNKERTHYAVKLKSGYTKKETFVDQNFQLLPLVDSGNMDENQINTALSEILQVDPAHRIAKMKISKELAKSLRNNTQKNFENNLLYLKSWFRTHVCEIIEIKQDTLYFRHGKISESDSFKNVINGDVTYSKMGKDGILYPQFFITNIGKHERNKVYIENDNLYVPIHVTNLYECKYQQFTSMRNILLNNLIISNIIFSGSSLAKPVSDSDSQEELLHFFNVEGIHIINNTFRNIGNKNAILISGSCHDFDKFVSNNHKVKNNQMVDSYGLLIETWIINNIEVSNNYTDNTGLFHKFGGVIHVRGNNFLIKRNTIKNFSYTGIRAGIDIHENAKTTGVIEENEIFYDDIYKKYYERHTIMDGGAIYLWTRHDSTICRNNIIHNTKGRRDYRGIFCDDGTYNVALTGNLVYDITDFSIYAYYRDAFGNRSFNNRVENNILLEKYYFRANPKYNENKELGCKKGVNYTNNTQNVVSNVVENLKDIYDPGMKKTGNKIVLTKDTVGMNIHPFILERIIVNEKSK